MEKKTKIIIWITLILILLWFIYQNSETYKRKIDEYNFKQLEIVKNVLDWKKLDLYEFQTLSEFNKKYNLNIKPKKNCYYISSENWDEEYIFWFQLVSIYYKTKYNSDNYAFPKNDLSDKLIYLWMWSNYVPKSPLDHYHRIISSHCKK